MKARKIVSGATVVALALAGVLTLSTAASADDLAPPPVEETAPTEVVEAPAPVEAPAEPVAEPPAEPVESAPAPEQAPPPSEPVSEAQVPAPAPVVQTLGGEHQPDMICDESGEGWGPKIDTSGDPATVAVNADSGFLIDAYCVKAGTTKHIVNVTPAASVVVDHPEKDSVSHYQVHQIKAPVEEEPPTPTLQACETFASNHTTDLGKWDFSQTRATGHYELVEGGLHVWTEGATTTDKVAGYIGASFPLADLGTGFGLAVTGSGGAQPGFQALVDLDNDGDAEGYLVGEPAYGPDSLWLSANWGGADLSSAPTTANGGGTGKGGAANAWLEAFPNAKVYAIGFSLGSGVLGDWTITSITAGCTVYTFDYVAPPTFEPKVCEVLGSANIDHDGVLSVEGEWATAEVALPFTGTLADLGTTFDVTADKTQYLGLHIDTAEGTIVFEEEPSYGGNLWSPVAWAGVEAGMGYPAFGSIEEFVHLNGDVQVTGIRVLYTHPEASTTTVESVTIGCTVYTFREVPAQPESLSGTEYESIQTICVEPLDGTAWVEVHAVDWTQEYVFDEEAWEWVLGEKVYGEPYLDHVDAVPAEEECAPVVVTPDPTCEDYVYQEDAQAAFDADPEGLAALDGDGDGIACENLPNEPGVVTPAPTPTTPAPAPAAKSASTATLPATGGPETLPWTIGGAVALALGALAVVIGARVRRQD